MSPPKRVMIAACLLFLGCRAALSIAAGVSVHGNGGRPADGDLAAHEARQAPPR